MSDSASTQDTRSATNEASPEQTLNQAVPAEAPVKPDYPSVFVGNLNFQTTEGQLKDYFSQAGEVKEVHIITRGPRSMGYGFVAFADQQSADKAVTTLNKTDLDGREINVEAARPMPERAPLHRPRRRFQSRRRFPLRGKDSDEIDDNGNAFSTRPPRSRPQGPRVESSTVAYISNLPFSTTVDELSDFFGDFSIADTHIPVRSRTGRSKGFGFVTFDNHDEQQRAVEYFAQNQAELSGRPISVSVAFELPEKVQNQYGNPDDAADTQGAPKDAAPAPQQAATDPVAPVPASEPEQSAQPSA